MKTTRVPVLLLHCNKLEGKKDNNSNEFLKFFIHYLKFWKNFRVISMKNPQKQFLKFTFLSLGLWDSTDVPTSSRDDVFIWFKHSLVKNVIIHSEVVMRLLCFI